jgi:hypothetical protein
VDIADYRCFSCRSEPPCGANTISLLSTVRRVIHASQSQRSMQFSWPKRRGRQACLPARVIGGLLLSNPAKNCGG